MADIKVIYKNAAGFDQEHSESADSVKMLSFKTANAELSDSALQALVSSGDASTVHNHDSLYFRETEHIDATAGAADAAKPVKTDATGYINPLIDTAALVAQLDHGGLSGLGDDDHIIYSKADGSRDFTSQVKYATLISITDDKALVHKKYVQDAIMSAQLGDEFTVESAQERLVVPPVSPTAGYRVLVDASLGTPSGAFAGQENKIAEYDGSAWSFVAPTIGTFISVDSEATGLFYFGGASWSMKSFEATTASTGLVKIGVDVQLDSAAAGAGLAYTSGVLSVVADESSLEVVGDQVRVKALGISDSMINFGTGAGQVSAADLPIADAVGIITATNVEGALQELQYIHIGELYTTGEAIAKGDLVYLSAADTISKVSNLSNNVEVVGVAAATYASGVPARARRVRGILTAVLPGATPGLPIYWTATGPSQTPPSASGSNVYKLGVAKNAAGDMAVCVEHIKKNA